MNLLAEVRAKSPSFKKDKTIMKTESEFEASPRGMSYAERAEWHEARVGQGPGGDNRGNTHGHAAMALWGLCRRNDGSINREAGRDYCIPKREARLMATAPELLAALNRLVDDLVEAHEEELSSNHGGDGPDCSYCRSIAVARAAIAKATGGGL